MFPELMMVGMLSAYDVVIDNPKEPVQLNIVQREQQFFKIETLTKLILFSIQYHIQHILLFNTLKDL